MDLKQLAKIVLILSSITLISVSGFSISEWEVSKIDRMSERVVSTSQTIQMVNVTSNVTNLGLEDPYPLEKSDLFDESNVTYTYNSTNGTSKELTELSGGYWYAKFDPNLSKGGNITYSANGTTITSGVENSGEEANFTENLTIGRFNVEIVSNWDKKVKAGRNTGLEVIVRNRTGEKIDDSEASVQLEFKNLNAPAQTHRIDNYGADPAGNKRFYNFDIEYPDNPDTTYIANIKAYNGSINPSNINGTTSRIINIAPQIKGGISTFYSEDGCSNQSMVYNCEDEANISIKFDVTNAKAKNINLSAYAFNKSGSHLLTTKNMALNNTGEWVSNYTVPDLNTSTYGEEIELVFNATNNYRNYVERKNISISNFKIQDRSSPTTFLGQQYGIDIFLGKPYTLKSYNKSRFNEINFTIKNSNDTKIGFLNKENISYSSVKGIMEGSILISEDNPTGTYSLDIKAKNIFNRSNTYNSGFNVKSVNATFDAVDEKEFQIDRVNSQNVTFEVENLLSETHELSPEVVELEQNMNFTNETIELGPNSEEDVKIQVKLQDLKDSEGKIRLTDESVDYSETTTLKFNTPNCKTLSGYICGFKDSVEATATGNTNFTKFLDIKYVGPEGGSVNYETNIEGEIGQHLTLANESQDQTLSSQNRLSLIYSPISEGLFEGDLLIDTNRGTNTTIPLSLNYNYDENQTKEENETETTTAPSFEIDPQEVSLGNIVSDESVTKEVEITNNGESRINSVSASSTSFVTSLSSVEIPSSTSKKFNVQISDVDTSGGSITITAENLGGSNSNSITVSASPIENYKEKTSELNQRIRDLQKTAPENLKSNLSQASTKVSEIETEWDAGNYQSAKSSYEEIQTELNTIERESVTGSNEEKESNSGGSILPLLLIIIILFSVTGFVIFTSYVPEEGDPLYNVLGENQ